MFAGIAQIVFSVAESLRSSDWPESGEPGRNGRTFRHSSHPDEATQEIRRTYRDEADLARQIAALDEEFNPSRLTVVIVLDERTRQAFGAETIRRAEPASRLAITTTFGAGPAHNFVGDLYARAHVLGWRQIVCDRNCDRAVRDSLDSMHEGESCVVFRPW